MLALFAVVAIAPSSFGPMLAPGTRREFQQQILAVTDLVEKGDFAAAKKLATRLPKGELTIEWDDHKVPAGYRQVFRQVLDDLLLSWRSVQSQFLPRIVPKGGALKFSFEPDLPINPDTGIRTGSSFIFSGDPSKPALEVVIGLKRGEPPVQTGPFDVYNEAARGVGVYYGLSDSVNPGSFMSKNDLPTGRTHSVNGFEGSMIGSHLRAIAEIQSRIDKAEKFASARPKVSVDPLEINGPPILQGVHADFQINLKNVGNAPLAYRIVPDCSCIITSIPDPIPAGATRVVTGHMDTTRWTGEVHHSLWVVTNDFETPDRLVSYKVTVQPRYRLLFDSPDVLLISGDTVTVHGYLFTPLDRPMSVVKARIDGIPGTVTSHPWQGELADPAMKEGPLLRQGTEFTIQLKTAGVVGRTSFTLLAETDDASFATVQSNQPVQKGIASLPSQVYLGEVSAPSTTAFVLSQPGKPFRILSMSVDNPYLKAVSSTLKKPGEYQIDVKYVGGAQQGFMNGVLTITTDDHDSPTVKVPLQVTVR
jgi:hypothetical protein